MADFGRYKPVLLGCGSDYDNRAGSHQTLGGTLEIIAGEKAGIIKAGVPVVIGMIDPSPLSVITSIAAERKAPVYLYNQDYFVTVVQNSIDGVTFDYHFEDHVYSGLKANLIGSHQANVATALTAFILYCRARDIRLSEAAIRQALNSINWRGRMQPRESQSSGDRGWCTTCRNPGIICKYEGNVPWQQSAFCTVNIGRQGLSGDGEAGSVRKRM